MKKILQGSVVLLASSFCHVSMANNDITAEQIRNVMVAHVEASSKDTESLDGVLSTMHTGSPAYMDIKAQLEQVFPIFDMNVSLAEFSLVGVDGEYAVSRLKLKMEKVSGPMFQDHVSEQIFVFKQEGDEWKIWQAAMLNMEFL